MTAMRAFEFLPPKPRRARQAVRWHVGATATVSIMGTACICLRADKNGYLFQSIKNPEHTIPLTWEEFDLLKEGYEFELDPEGMKPAKAAAVLRSDEDMVRDLPEGQREKVKAKIVAIKKFLSMQQRGAASRYRQNLAPVLKQMQAELNEESAKGTRGGKFAKPPLRLVGPKRFLEWVDTYLELGPLGLVDAYQNCGSAPYYKSEERAQLLRYVYKYLSPERPTVALLWRDMDKEITERNFERRRKGLQDLRCPEYDLLRDEIHRLPPFDVVAARWSPEKAMRFFHPSKGGVPGLVRPMQRVEADDWTTHLHTLLIDAGLWESVSNELQAQATKVRCVLSVAICCTTRVIPAVTLALNTGASNTRALLRMCLSDKTTLAQAVGCETPWEYRGLPEIFVVDEGSALLNVETELLCRDLGIGFKSPQIDMPQQRAKVERFLQTLDVRALLRFSGRAFSNPVVRGKYESAARACVTVPELAALVVRFIVDEYHNVEHAGLGGETPRSVWLRLSKKYAPTAPPGPSRIRRAFGEDYAVVLQAQGIQIFGNWYTSRATDDLFQKVGDREYTVRVDSEDLGAVSLRVPGGWLTLLGPDVMKGVSVAVWEAALADLRRQNQDLQDLVRPVVHRAIAFAQMADAETRKRLSILYRPKSGPELEALRRRMNATVRHRQEILAPQARPIDILADPIPVGRKASTRTIRPAGARDAGPRPNPVEPEPKRPRRRRKSPTAPKHAEPQRKPPRPWKIRKR